MPGWCKNLNRNLTCQPNSCLDKDENNEVCYKCLETNMGGTRCNICEEGYVKNSKGYCIDESLCDIIDGSECIQCKQKLEIDGHILSLKKAKEILFIKYSLYINSNNLKIISIGI